MADESKNPPILRRTPFVGSGGNRMVHKTDRDCPRSRDIKPDERWYIKEIPKDGNYTLCPYCFGDDSTPLPDVQAPESRFKNLFSRKTKEQRESLPETDRSADGGAEVSVEESGPQEAAEAVTPPAGKSTRKSVAGSAAGGKSAVKIAVVQKKAMEDSVEKKAVVKKAAPKKKVAPKKKAAPKKKVAPKKKAAPKKKVAPKKKAAPKKKVAPKK